MFAACTDGIQNLAIAAQASHRRVRAGKSFKYRVILRGSTKKSKLELKGLVLRVLLPEGTRYSKGIVYPKLRKPSKGHGKGFGKGFGKGKYGKPTPVLLNNTVTWPLTGMGGVKKRYFIMKVVTDRDLPPSSLTLAASVFEDSEAGLSVCPRAANPVTVIVG